MYTRFCDTDSYSRLRSTRSVRIPGKNFLDNQMGSMDPTNCFVRLPLLGLPLCSSTVLPYPYVPWSVIRRSFVQTILGRFVSADVAEKLMILEDSVVKCVEVVKCFLWHPLHIVQVEMELIKTNPSAFISACQRLRHDKSAWEFLRPHPCLSIKHSSHSQGSSGNNWISISMDRSSGQSRESTSLQAHRGYLPKPVLNIPSCYA